MKELSGHDMIHSAKLLAQKAHAGQVDKAGADYFLHPEKVASMVESDEEKAVAYLHDIVEDTSISLDDLIKEGFPDAVVAAVDAITRRKSEKYENYLERVAKNSLALSVKLADIEHNSDASRFPVGDERAEANAEKYRIKKMKLLALSRGE